MTTLQIIVHLVTSVAYVFLIALCITTFRYFRRQQDDIDHINRTLHLLMGISMGEHLRQNVDELNDMKERLEELVEEDRYEDAQRLKQIIDEQERSVKEQIDKFRDTFGEDTVRVEVTKFNFK